MKIFLTGATGYVGSAVLETLVRAGQDVTALVRDPEKAEYVSRRGVHAIIGDLDKPASYASEAEGAEVIVHTALDSSARVRRLATVITVFGFVYGFYAILQMVLSPDKIYGIYKPQSAVPFGSFVNRHDFAAVMEMSISVPLGMMFAAKLGEEGLLFRLAGQLEQVRPWKDKRPPVCA